MAKYVHPNMIIDSSAAFLKNVTFDSSVYFQGVTHINAPAAVSSQTPFALVLESGSGTDLQVKSVQLGTMAKENATSWDASLSAIRTDIGNLETSVGALDTLTQSHTTQLGIHNASIGVLTSLTAVHDSSLGFLNAYRLIQDASIAANWQRWIDSNRSGFVDRSQTTLSFTDTTGTVTLNDVGSGWSYYRDGIKYTISGNKSVALPDGGSAVAGVYYITIEGTDGALTVDTTVWDLNDPNVLPVSIIIWNASNSPKYWMTDERHTMLIDRKMHQYLHTTQGTKLVAGGTLDGPDVSVNTNAANAIGWETTTIADEDIFLNIAALARPNGTSNNYVVFYRTDANTWTWKQENTPLSENGSFIEWDNAGTLTTGQTGKYYTSYVGFTDLNDAARVIIIPGRGEYDTLDAARDEDVTTFDFTTLPAREFVLAWKLVWRADTAYTTYGKAVAAAEPIRVQVNVTTSSGATTESHNDLLGLQGGTSTERYHLSAAQYNDYIGESEVLTLINDVSTRLDTRLDNHDTSIATLNTLIQNLESSVGDLDTLTQGHTTDINNLESSVGGLDTLTRTHTSQIAQLDASIVRIDSYQSVQDASIAALVAGNATAWNGLTKTDTSIGLGGTLVQDTVINTSVYQLGVLGSMQISGDLTVDGSITYINTTELDVSDNIIQINSGLTGTPPVNMVSGIKVDRGSDDPYFFIFSEATDTFRIGINASEGGLPFGTQAVATREDTPIATAVPFWNSAENRFDTNSGLTFAAGTGLDVNNRLTVNELTLQNIPNLTGEATALVIGTDGSVGYRELGTGAFAVIANYATLTYVDGSLASRDTSIAYLNAQRAQLDASIVRIDSYQAIQDASIVAAGTSVKAWNGLTRVDNSIGLGGTLVDYITINTSDYTFGVQYSGDSGNINFSVDSYGVQMSADDGLGPQYFIGVYPYSVYLAYGGSHSIELSDQSGMIVTDSSSVGLQYADDYESTFVDRSLVTKQFVTGLISDVSSNLSTNYLKLSGGTMTGLLALAAGGFSLDGVTITTIDTSAEGGLGQLDTAIPTSGAVTKAIAAAISAGVTASNGLTETAGDIKLGGTLSQATTIDISTHSLALTNLVSGTTRLAVISDGGVLKTQQLGTMALEASANYYYASQVNTLVSDLSTLIDNRLDLVDADIAQIEASIVRIDASLNDVIDIFTVLDASFAAVWLAIDNVEASVGALDTLTQSHTTDINNLESSVGALDLLTQNHTQSIADLSTGKLDAVATVTGIDGGHEVFSNEADNIAYIKKIVAGTGATITSDASTITIAVSGAAGYVSKYAGTFDGTAGTSLSVTAATHGRGIGPLQVTVYDGTDQVWVDVDCAANGDITLEWTGGSLSASCKYIIMG